MAWIITRRYDTYHEMTNTSNGALRKVALASDKQWDYLESLRLDVEGKIERLANRPYAHVASKRIDKLLEKQEKRDRQQTLL